MKPPWTTKTKVLHELPGLPMVAERLKLLKANAVNRYGNSQLLPLLQMKIDSMTPYRQRQTKKGTTA